MNQFVKGNVIGNGFCRYVITTAKNESIKQLNICLKSSCIRRLAKLEKN